MQEKARQDVKQDTDHMLVWKQLTGAVVWLGTFFLFRNVLGVPWFCALFLAFPAASMARGVADGKPDAVFHGLIMLILAPFLIGPCKALAERVSEIPFVGNIPVVKLAALGGVSLVVLAGLFFFCKLFSKLTPIDCFPPKIRRYISAAVCSLTLILSTVFTWKGMFWLNEHFLHYGSIRIFAFVICGTILILGALQIIRGVLAPQPSPDGANTDGVCLAERPDIRLNDVAGMNEVKEQIRLRLIEPLRDPQRAKKYNLKPGGGVLLYGPPGTGKTFLARAVAGELNLPFYMITSADVFGRYVGDSEKNILRIFQEARKHKLSVIFIDEMETIFRKRTDDIHEVTQKVISVILQEMDGVVKHKNPILLLGATNMPWQIDEAFLRPGRFDVLAFVGLPSAAARHQMLARAFATGLPCEPGMVDYMTAQTENFSGADLNGVITKMRQRAFDSRAEKFTSQMAYEVMISTPPSSKKEILSRIREWEASR